MRNDLKRRVDQLEEQVAELMKYIELMEELRRKYHPTRQELLEKLKPKGLPR